MPQKSVFTVPLTSDRKDYRPIQFNHDFSPEDRKRIEDSVSNIQNSTECEGTSEIETEMGKISVRFKRIDERFKSIEGFMEVQDRTGQQTVSASAEHKQECRTDRNSVHNYEVYLRNGQYFTVTALNCREESGRYIFTNPDSQETIVFVSVTAAIHVIS